MVELFRHYLANLYHAIPTSLFVCLAVVFVVSLIVCLVMMGIRRGVSAIAKIAIAEYLVLIYSSTLMVSMRTYKEIRGYELLPFWSYASIQEGRENLIAENIMNVIVFIPLGFLFAMSYGKVTWKHVAVWGMAVSVSIEIMQYVLKRGFSETDDVMHNTLGCIIGYGLWSLIMIGYERFSKRSVGVL